MKDNAFYLTLLFYLLTLMLCQAQQQLNTFNYDITPWQNGLRSATVMTFDDWSPGQKAIVVPTLIAKELQATLFITTQNIWSNSEYAILNNAVAHDIEVANHTISHPDLTALTADSLHKEVSGVTSQLHSFVTGQTVSTFAYPYGAYNSAVIAEVKKQLIAARTVSRPASGHWEYEFAQTIDDYYTLPTISIDPSYTTANFGIDVEVGMSDGGLVTFLIHSVYNSTVDDHWYNALSETQLDDFLDKLNTYKNQTWITSLSNAVCYHKERQSATLALTSDNSTTMTLQLSDTLSNNDLYKIPLTIKVAKSPAITYASITQNGNEISFSYSSANDSVVFHAVPDGGDIVLEKNSTLGIATSDQASAITIYPMPAKDVVTIQGNGISGKVRLSIYDQQGIVIQSQEMDGDGTNASVNTQGLSSGMYTLHLQNDLISYTQKLLIIR